MRLVDFIRLQPYFILSHHIYKNFSAYKLHPETVFEGRSAVLITSREAAREEASLPEPKKQVERLAFLYLCPLAIEVLSKPRFLLPLFCRYCVKSLANTKVLASFLPCIVKK